MLEIKRFQHKHLHARNGGQNVGKHGGVNYYVLASVGKDRMLWGPYRTHDQADRMGLSRANGNFEVMPLETSDLGTATQILRERGILEKGLNSDSFRRFKHT